jgi:hypothetical protein
MLYLRLETFTSVAEVKMRIQSLSNSELMARFGKLVQTERKITHLVLECIAEIDARKIYLERAYPSLYDFMVKEFGYSPSAAMRRIESARLLRDIPEMSEKIEAGALNLSQLSKVQQAIRTVQKIEDRKLDVAEKRNLLRKIEYTTQNQTELILAQELSLPVINEEREKLHRDESVSITMPFTKEQMTLLEKVQDLTAHCVPEKKWSDLVVYLAEKELRARTQTKHKVSNKNNFLPAEKTPEQKLNSPEQIFQPESIQVRKPITPSQRKALMKDDGHCKYRDPITNKTCDAKRFAQVDHKTSIWAGGSNEDYNLQVLCAAHNRLKYAKESGLHPLRR